MRVKALLDTYTQTEADLADAVAKKHSHSNKAILDAITDAKVAAWDAAESNANSYTDTEIAKIQALTESEIDAAIAQAISTRDSLRDSAVKYADIVSTAITNADQENEVIKEAVTIFDLYGDALERINGAQENQTDKIQESTESNEDLAEVNPLKSKPSR